MGSPRRPTRTDGTPRETKGTGRRRADVGRALEEVAYIAEREVSKLRAVAGAVGSSGRAGVGKPLAAEHLEHLERCARILVAVEAPVSRALAAMRGHERELSGPELDAAILAEAAEVTRRQSRERHNGATADGPDTPDADGEAGAMPFDPSVGAPS